MFLKHLACQKLLLFRTPAHTAKMYPLLAGYSQGSSGRRVTLLPGTSFLRINGTRNAVGGLLFFGQLILMQNLFNIGKQSKGNYYCFQIWYQQRNGDISACKHLSLLFNWATHWNKKNPFFRLFTISRWLLKVLLRQFFFCSYFPPFHASIYFCGIYNCIDWNILHKYKLAEAEDQNPFWFW